MAEVDEVPVVGEDMCGFIATAGAVLLEQLDIGGSQWFGFPLSLVAGEHGKSPGPNFTGIQWSVFNSPCNTDVGTDGFHADHNDRSDGGKYPNVLSERPITSLRDRGRITCARCLVGDRRHPSFLTNPERSATIRGGRLTISHIRLSAP